MIDYERMPAFNIGDVVELKATGLRVTVDGPETGSHYFRNGERMVGPFIALTGNLEERKFYTGNIGIVWFDHQNNLHRDTVPEECLQLYVGPCKSEPAKLDLSSINTVVDRQRHAELLIEQLPTDHDGRNTWLLNYGNGHEASSMRFRRKLAWDSANHSAACTDS